jgi:hypothetical protein
MQHAVLMRYTRHLHDDVGIPPEPRAVQPGEVHTVLSNHAAWLEERGFAERVTPPAVDIAAIEDPVLQSFVRELESRTFDSSEISQCFRTPISAVSEMETAMRPEHANKMVVPAKKKRGRPVGSKNRPKS